MKLTYSVQKPVFFSMYLWYNPWQKSCTYHTKGEVAYGVTGCTL